MLKKINVPMPVYATLIFVKTVVLVGLLAGCATAPDVRVDKAAAANLASYKTFSFNEQSATDGSPGYTSVLSVHLKQSTRDALERHGYVYSDKNPDLKVNFNVDIRDRQELRTYPTSNGVIVRRAGLQDYSLVNYRQGTVSVDLVDNHMQSLVWQGVANRRVDDKLIEDPGKAINNVVQQIFAGFPQSKAD